MRLFPGGGWIVPLILFLFLVPGVRAAPPLSGEEILARVDAHLYPGSYEQYMTLVNLRPNGTKDQAVVYVARSEEGKSILVVVTPDSLVGRGVFRYGGQVWERETGSMDPYPSRLTHNLLGGGFDYTDLLPVEFQSLFSVAQFKEEDHEFRLQLQRQDTEATPCLTMEMRVDKKLLLPLETVCQGLGGQEIKRVQYRKITQFGQLPPRPAELETRNALNHGYISRLTLGRMSPRAFANELFCKENLYKAGELLK